MTDKERTLIHGVMDFSINTCQRLTALVFEHALNDMVRADSECISKLIEMRAPCNDAVMESTLAVPYAEKEGDPLSLGVLGVLNAIMGLHGLILIANYSDKECKHFTRFSVHQKRKEADSGNTDVESTNRSELRETASRAEGSR